MEHVCAVKSVRRAMGIRTVAAGIFVFLLGVGSALANDIVWAPQNNSTDWSSPYNWNPQMLPGSNDTAIINSAGAGVQNFTTTVGAVQNTGSVTARLAVQFGGTLTVNNGITATSNFQTSVGGGLYSGGQATLNLGGTSTLPGIFGMGVSANGYLNLLANATATIRNLNVSGSGGYEGIAALATGAQLNANFLDLGSAGGDSIGVLTMAKNAVASSTQGFYLAGEAVLHGGTLNLAGTQDVGQAYSGGPELSGGYVNGLIGAGSAASTLNLGSDVNFGGTVNGSLTSGYAANANLAVNNTAGRTIYLVDANVSSPLDQVVFGGNMDFVSASMDGSAGGIVLKGDNTFTGATQWGGYINLADGSVTTANYGIGALSDAPTINLLGNAQLIVTNNGAPGAASITGTINISPGASLELDDAYLNNATVNSSGNFYVPNGYTQTGGTEDVNGTLNAGTSDVTVNGGTLQGDGTIQAANVNVGDATIKPGNSPGTLTIDGNLMLSAGTTTRIQLEGDTPGTEFDDFNVDAYNGQPGNVVLAGYLDTELLNGFIPTVGDSFDFLNYQGSLSGSFSGLYDYINGLEHWVIDYSSAGHVALDVVAGKGLSTPKTPEPGTWIMLASALGLALACAGSRKERV